MPGESFKGQIPDLSANQNVIREKLKKCIKTIASEIGERNVFEYDKLCEAARFIEESFTQKNHEVNLQPYNVYGKTCVNIELELRGKIKEEEIVIIGAHYDTVAGSPGANDNGSGVATMLELANFFSKKDVDRTLRFVAFVNEEPPFFQSGKMGSRVYARNCSKHKEKICAMLSLETLGYYSEKEHSQSYPVPLSLFYPSTGNFVGFVGNLASGQLVRRIIKTFRNSISFPSEGAVLPSWMTGIGWSDQWSFWQSGYQAVMVTDTALFRYPYYHTPEDTPEHIDYDRLTLVVQGLQKVIEDLVSV